MTGVAGAHMESVLESEIADHLAAHGWKYSPTDDGYDRVLALFPEDVLGWLKDSQPTEFAKVVRPNDTEAQRDAAERSILNRLAKALDNDPLKNGGTIRILHEGFSMVPLLGGTVKFALAQFRPATTNNPDTLEAYAKMRVRVMRQVHYSAKNPHVRYFVAEHGYALVTVTPQDLTCEFHYVADEWDPTTPISHIDTWRVLDGEHEAQPV